MLVIVTIEYRCSFSALNLATSVSFRVREEEEDDEEDEEGAGGDNSLQCCEFDCISHFKCWVS